MAHDVEVFVGNVDNAVKHDGLIGADLDRRPVRRIRISGLVNLLFQLAESANSITIVAECCWNEANGWGGARSIGRAQVRPLALALIVRKSRIVVRQVLPPKTLMRLVWVVLNIPKRIIVFGIFRLAFAELDDGEGKVGIGSDVGLVDQLEDGRLTNILVVLDIYENEYLRCYH